MKRILLLGLIFVGCTEGNLTNQKLDSLKIVTQHQQKQIDSLLFITTEIESYRELKEAKTLLSKWAWGEAELKLINILKKHPETNEAKESLVLLSLVEDELTKINIKPIQIEDVIKEDKLRIENIKKQLLGKKYELPFSKQLIEKYGFPETQPGTNGKIWIAFFPYGQFTAFMDKDKYEIYDIRGNEWWKGLSSDK